MAKSKHQKESHILNQSQGREVTQAAFIHNLKSVIAQMYPVENISISLPILQILQGQKKTFPIINKESNN